MKGIAIRDRTNLRDILWILGDDVRRSSWRATDVQCLGAEGTEALHRASDTGDILEAGRLIALAEQVDQVTDGEFTGRLADEDWIVIRAVDSSAFDVETDRGEVIERLRASFEHVDELPP